MSICWPRGPGEHQPLLEEAAESLGLTPFQRVMKISFPLVLPALSAGGLLAHTFHRGFRNAAAHRARLQRLRDRSLHALLGRSRQQSRDGDDDQHRADPSFHALRLQPTIHVAAERLPRQPDQQADQEKAERLPERAGAWGRLLHRPRRRDAGDHRGHLLGEANERAGLPARLRLDSYRRILFNLADVVQNSLAFSFATVALIVTVGTLIGCLVARRMTLNTSMLDATLMVPYVMPGIVVGIAFVAAFNSPPLALTGTALVIILSIFIRRLPYSVRSAASALRLPEHGRGGDFARLQSDESVHESDRAADPAGHHQVDAELRDLQSTNSPRRWSSMWAARQPCRSGSTSRSTMAITAPPRPYRRSSSS